MAKRKCRGSDHISKLARDLGFHKWQTLWDANTGLNRANPNVLFKGDKRWRSRPDRLDVPDKKPKEEPCATDDDHVFELPTYKLFLRLRVLKEDFKPVSDDCEYELTIWDSRDKQWLPPEDMPPLKKGIIEVEIPQDAERGELTVRIKAGDTDAPPAEGKAEGKAEGQADAGGDDAAEPLRGDVPITWQLKIGALNPIMEKAPNKWCISGVQQRMNNLALDSGPVDGIRGPITRAAVTEFQRIFKLDQTSKPDQAKTQSKLQEVHDTSADVVVPG